MILFCRHCYKPRPIRTEVNGPHIQAICTECGNWIKFLNAKEKTQVITEQSRAAQRSKRRRSR